jgi:hypothetical protein
VHNQPAAAAALGHHPDDDGFRRSHFHGLTDRIVAAIEQSLPELKAEDHDRLCVALFVGIDERSAKKGRHASHTKRRRRRLGDER